MTDLDALLAEFAATAKTGPVHDDISADDAAKRYCNRELAMFHAYNPNGVAAQWRELSKRLIAFGRGYAAYGDCGYLYNELTRLADYRRQRVATHELNAVLHLIRRTIERGNAFLAENNA